MFTYIHLHAIIVRLIIQVFPLIYFGQELGTAKLT